MAARRSPSPRALATQLYFPSHIQDELKETGSGSENTERAKRILLQEYFSNTTRLPAIKGYCQEREGSSKKWKKRFFLLRASGVYFSAKGESEAPADLQCFVKFDEVDACRWASKNSTKKDKAPTEFVLVFKPRARKQSIAAASLKSLACPDEAAFNMWTAGIRLAKFGTKLKENFDSTTRKFRELVRIGEADTTTLLPEGRDVSAVHSANKVMIEQWKSQRADKSNPLVSAATGVEFDQGDSNGVAQGLLKYRWYHGPISRDEVNGLMQAASYAEGSFLVRDSTSAPGDYVLSLCYTGKVRHFMIKKVRSRLRAGFDRSSPPRLLLACQAVSLLARQ